MILGSNIPSQTGKSRCLPKELRFGVQPVIGTWFLRLKSAHFAEKGRTGKKEG